MSPEPDPVAPTPPDETARLAARDRLDRLTKPRGSLGRLEDLAAWAAAVQGRCPPRRFGTVDVLVIAGDHDIVSAAGTSAFPPEVTPQMVANILAGGAAVNVLAQQQGATVTVIDAAVASTYDGLPVPPDVGARRIRPGSGAIDRTDAMSEDECRRALALGAELVAESSADLLIVGDMGIGNTTASATLIAALTDNDPVAATGRGTGIDDTTWMRKVAAVRDALWRVRHDRGDPMVLLRRAGGVDLAVMVGILTAAAASGVPVLLDGVVICAAALVAEAAQPGSAAWWCAGHRSAEPAATTALASLRLTPILEIEMRLGEGSGALVALPVLQSAIALLADMATFDSAGVTDRPDA